MSVDWAVLAIVVVIVSSVVYLLFVFAAAVS